jgi:hypothetical protein
MTILHTNSTILFLRVSADTGLRRAAEMNLIIVSGENLHIPDQKYSVEVELLTKLYSNMIKDLAGIAEDVRISISQKKIKFEADGDRGRVENVFYRGQGAFASTHWNVSMPADGPTHIEQSYALRFLAGFAKACPLSETVIFLFCTLFSFFFVGNSWFIRWTTFALTICFK